MTRKQAQSNNPYGQPFNIRQPVRNVRDYGGRWGRFLFNQSSKAMLPPLPNPADVAAAGAKKPRQQKSPPLAANNGVNKQGASNMTALDRAYVEGFMAKCAAAGVDAEELLLKSAQLFNWFKKQPPATTNTPPTAVSTNMPPVNPKSKKAPEAKAPKSRIAEDYKRNRAELKGLLE